MLADYLKISFLMMRNKPARAALSLLGIYIGVMALLVILAIRQGVREQIEDTFRTVGAHVILVMPGFDPVAKRIGRLTNDDVDMLRNERGVLSAYPRGNEDFDARTDAASMHAHVAGIDAAFVPLYRVPVLSGRTFFPDEVAKKRAVCLITASAAEKLFPVSEPIGATLTMNGDTYQVVGVVDWNMSVAQRTSMMDTDILIPISVWKFGDSEMMGIVEVRVSTEMSGPQAKRKVLNLLSHGDPSRETMYFVRSLDEVLARSRASNDRVLIGLLGIAAISLLVGGIGVANVMVTNVTERTREIGIRKALGATRIDILGQFLVESSVMCASGGFLAVLTGASGLMLLKSVTDIDIPMSLTPAAMGMCFALTVLIGLLAGAYPASRAAALSPAEALRYE